MADKDFKQEEATVEAAAKDAAPTTEKAKEQEIPDRDAATQDKTLKADNKKSGRKGGDKGKGGGKGKTAGGLPSGPFGHGSAGFRLNVKNFGADMTNEQLRVLFEPCGTVTEAEVKVREDGKSRGFGFVIMSSHEEAQKAIMNMNNKVINSKPLNVCPAERRPQQEGDEQGKGKGKGKTGKGAEALDMGWQAAMFQEQMMAWQQWYAYMATMDPVTGMPFAAPAAGSSVETPSFSTEYEGSLKSISAKNGYGFIACAATYALYERDVYVDKEVLPEGSTPPDRVKFTVTLNAKQHPKAATCTKAVP